MAVTTIKNKDKGVGLGTRLLSIVLVFSLLMMSLASVFANPMPALAQSSSNNDSGELEASTIFSVASAATNYIDIMLVNGQSNKVSGISPGNVAGGMGAVDIDSVKTLANDSALSEQSSKNVATRAYASSNKESTDLEKAVTAYGRYGAALNYLGLDETAPEQTSDLFRMISGRMLQFFWFMSNGVDALMGWACKILQALNPFRFLDGTATGVFGDGDIVNSTSQFDDVTDTTGEFPIDVGNANPSDINEVGFNGVFTTIRDAFSTVYSTVSRISWLVLMPLFLALAVFAIVMGRAVDQNMYQKGRSQARRWVVRVLFLLAAVPILGGIYTPLLNGMTNAFLASSTTSGVNADKVVASQLVDFQAWAYNSRLSVDYLDPAITVTYEGSDDGVLSSTSLPTDDSLVAVRNYANQINNHYGDINVGSADVIGGGGAKGTVLTFGDDAGDAGSSTYGDAKVGPEGDENIHDRLTSLLERYATGARYDSATYASLAMQDYSASKSDSAIGSIVREWRLIASDPANYAENLESSLSTNGGSSDLDVNPRGFLGEDNSAADTSKGVFVRVNGASKDDVKDKIADLYQDLVASDNPDYDAFREAVRALYDAEETATDSTPGAENQDQVDAVPWLSDGTLEFTESGDHEGSYTSSGAGLSTVGMYNYLSTVFASDGMHIYSSKETQNLPSRASHYSVTSIGSGTFGVLLMVDSIVLLMTFSLVGIAYALSMLFSNFKRGIQAMISLPFAMLGVLNSMARVVMLVLMMVVDLCTVFFLYQLICQGISAVNSALTDSVKYLAGHLDSAMMIPASMGFGVPAAGIASKVAVASILLLLAIAILIGFMILALRIRRGVINVSNEMISRVVEKFFESRGGTDAKSNVGQKAAAGAAIGASMMVRGGGGLATAGAATVGGLGLGTLVSAMSNAGKGGGTANLTGSATGDDSSAKAAGTGIAGLDRQSGATSGTMFGTISGDMSGTVSNVANDSGFDTSYGHAGSATANAMGGEGAAGGDAAAMMTAAAFATGQGGDAAGGMGAGGAGGVGVGDAAADSTSSAQGYGTGQGGAGAEGVGVGGAAKSVTAAYGGQGAGGSASASGYGTAGEADGVYGVSSDSSQAPMQVAALKSLGGAQDAQYAPGAYAPGQGEGSLSAAAAGYGGSSSANAEGAEGGAANMYGNEADSSAMYGVKAMPAGYSPTSGQAGLNAAANGYGGVSSSSAEAGQGGAANASGTESDSSALYGAVAQPAGYGTGGQADANAAAVGGANSAYGAGMNTAAFGMAAVGGNQGVAGIRAGDAATSSASASGKGESTYGAGSEAGLSAEGANAYGQAGAGGNPLSVATADAQGARASAEGGAQNQFAPDNMNSAEANAKSEEGNQNAMFEDRDQQTRGVQAGTPAVQVDAKSGDVMAGNLSGAVMDSSTKSSMSERQMAEKMARATEQGSFKATQAGGAGLQTAVGQPGSSAPGRGGAAGAAGAGGAAGSAGAGGAGGARGIGGAGGAAGAAGLGTSVGSTRSGMQSSDGIRHAKATQGASPTPAKTLGPGGQLSGKRANAAAAAAERADYLRKKGGASMGTESYNSAPGAVKAMGGASGPAGGGGVTSLGGAVQQTSLSPDYGGRSGGAPRVNGSRIESGSMPASSGKYGSSYSPAGGMTSPAAYSPSGRQGGGFQGTGGGYVPLSDGYHAATVGGPSYGVDVANMGGGAGGGTSLSSDVVNSANKSADIARQAAEERARQRSLEGSRFA